jgi:hypothetical protein
LAVSRVPLGIPDAIGITANDRRRTREADASDHRCGQIALTLLLLTSAGAAMNGFVRLVQADLGYDPHNTMSVGIPVHQNTHVSWEERSAYFDQLLKRIQAMPEVVVAGISSNATPPNNGWNLTFEIFGRPAGQKEDLRANFVSPEYRSGWADVALRLVSLRRSWFQRRQPGRRDHLRWRHIAGGSYANRDLPAAMDWTGKMPRKRSGAHHSRRHR